MVLKAGVTDTALLGVPESLLPELRAQAGLFSREDLIRLFDTFQKIETAMKFAAQVRFQLEMGLIELAHVARLRPIEELIAEFSGFAPDGAGVRPSGSQNAAASSSFSSRPPQPTPVPMPQPVRQNPVPAPRPQTPPSNPVEVFPPTSGGSGELLDKIAAAVERESLRSLLQSLAGARLEENRVVLDPGAINDFTRERVERSLKEIAEAASGVLGRQVAVVMAGAASVAPAPASAPPVQKPEQRKDVPPPSVPVAPAPALVAEPTPIGNTPETEGNTLMEKAKKDPVIRSFFDNFPGPASAEKNGQNSDR
jgi:DNA polymerase III gamma/tau subunit